MGITKDDIQQLIENDDLLEAEALSRQFIDAHPEDTAARVTLGRILAMQGEYEDSVTLFEEALGQDSQNFEASYYLARTYENLERFEEALNAYRQALATGEYSTYVHYCIGHLHTYYRYEKRSDEQARFHLRLATEGEKPVEDAFVELAKIEQPQRAIYVLQNGLRFFPESIKLHERLASRYFHLDDFVSCIDTITSSLEKGTDTAYLRFLLAQAYFEKEEYSEAQEALTHITIEEDEEQLHAFQCFRAIVLLEEGKHNAAIEALQDLIARDFRNKLDFAAHFLLICCHLRQECIQEAELVFTEVPAYQDHWDLFVYAMPIAFTFGQYFTEALSGLATSSDKAVAGKAKGTRAVERQQRFERPQGEEIDLESVKSDLLSAVSVDPDNTVYNRYLGYVLEELRDWVEAARYYILAQLNTDEELYVELDFLDNIYRNKTKFKKLLKEIDKVVSGGRYRWKNRFAQFFLPGIIEFLFSRKEYEKLIDIARQFEYRQLLTANILFELAYAYVETDNKRMGKTYYQAYLRDIKETSAVCNNLGLLYEDSSDLEKAKSLFQRALELDSNNDKAQGNLKRVQSKITQVEQEKRTTERAVHLFSQEDRITRRAIARLYEERAEDGLILCNPKRLATFLKLHTSEVDERVEEFIQKRYFSEVEDPGVMFDGVVLCVNAALVPELEKEIVIAREEDFVEHIAVELSSVNLDRKYGYNDSLVGQLSLLKSTELSTVLKRDLREAVTSLATQCYKSALVLCGSIVEAILMDQLTARRDSAIESLERILTQRGKKITTRDKRINQWTLNRLLEVAHEENLITENLYHWGHGIRGFRNLVHPGVEQRRTVEISKSNAEIAWNVVKRLLNELV